MKFVLPSSTWFGSFVLRKLLSMPQRWNIDSEGSFPFQSGKGDPLYFVSRSLTLRSVLHRFTIHSLSIVSVRISPKNLLYISHFRTVEDSFRSYFSITWISKTVRWFTILHYSNTSFTYHIDTDKNVPWTRVLISGRFNSKNKFKGNSLFHFK